MKACVLQIREVCAKEKEERWQDVCRFGIIQQEING